MARKCSVSLTMIDAARSAKSTPALVNVATRARKRAAAWARLLADWPALVEHAQRDAQAI